MIRNISKGIQPSIDFLRGYTNTVAKPWQRTNHDHPIHLNEKYPQRSRYLLEGSFAWAAWAYNISVYELQQNLVTVRNAFPPEWKGALNTLAYNGGDFGEGAFASIIAEGMFQFAQKQGYIHMGRRTLLAASLGLAATTITTAELSGLFNTPDPKDLPAMAIGIGAWGMVRLAGMHFANR